MRCKDMKDHELDALMEKMEFREEDERMIALSEADDIALEINVIKRRLAQETILAAVEIGKLLCRAKDKVPHGMWGEWLADNVSYSQSTANNMMRLYREYGEQEQLDFFAENRMEIFGNLSQSQAVALLGIPYEKRKEYVESHDMEKTSVREVEADVAAMREELAAMRSERDSMGDELMRVKKTLQDTEIALDEAKFRAMEAENTDQTRALKEEISALEAQVASAEESRDSAVKSAQKNEKAHGKAAKEWAAEKKRLEKQLEEARAAAQDAGDGDVDEEKRAEIEAAVAAVYEAKMEALARDHQKEIMAVGNPAVIEVNLLFGELQETYARIASLIEGLRRESPEVGDKLSLALTAALKTMIGG